MRYGRQYVADMLLKSEIAEGQLGGSEGEEKDGRKFQEGLRSFLASLDLPADPALSTDIRGNLDSATNEVLDMLQAEGLVRRTKGQGTFPSWPAPRDGRKFVVCIWPDIPKPFFQYFLRELIAEASKEDLDVVVADSLDNVETESALVKRFAGRCAGIVVASQDAGRAEAFEEYAGLFKLSPLVFADRFCYSQRGRAPVVSCDNFGGGEHAAKLLIREGGAANVFYAAEALESSSSIERCLGFAYAAYWDILKQPPPDWNERSKWNGSEYADRARKYIADLKSPGLKDNLLLSSRLRDDDAGLDLVGRVKEKVESLRGTRCGFFCTNDNVAAGIYQGLEGAQKEQGFMVGKDFGLVGFDGFAETSLLKPGLTSIWQKDVPSLAREAMRWIRRGEVERHKESISGSWNSQLPIEKVLATTVACTIRYGTSHSAV